MITLTSFQSRISSKTRWSSQRGFSLLELVVVVIVISVLAVVAMPSITKRLRDRRVNQAAQEVSIVYRNARMRAMGRGSAMLVRFNSAEPTSPIRVFEAVRGPGPDVAAGCERLPASGCLSHDWEDETTRIAVTQVNLESDVFIDVYAAPGNGAQVTEMDLCFSPLGRAFVRYSASGLLTPLVGVPRAEVLRRNDANAPIGLIRNVMILPNGTARLGL